MDRVEKGGDAVEEDEAQSRVERETGIEQVATVATMKLCRFPPVIRA